MAELPDPPWQFRVATGDRPPTVNHLTRLRSRGYDGVGQAATLLRQWKQATHDGLLESNLIRLRLGQARFEFTGIYPKGRLPDADGLATVGKAVADQIVADGVLPDDSPEHCLGVVFHPPRRNARAPFPLLVVEIAPVR